MKLSHADIELVALAFGNPPTRGWVRASCPLCEQRTGKRDVHQSMGLNCATGGFVCHKCQSTGWLKGVAVGVPADEITGERPPEPAVVVESCEGYLALGQGAGASAAATEPHRQYLKSRGVTREIARAAQIGCVLSGWHAGRVVVPHLLPDAPQFNPWAGWVGRDITGHARLKYRYSKGLRRAHMWNEAALSVETSAPVLLVEGVFDALPYWPDVCAFLGKPTALHFATLSAHRGRPIVAALDGDSWEEGWVLAQKLRFAGCPAHHLVVPAGEDPGSHRITTDAVRAALNGRVSSP